MGYASRVLNYRFCWISRCYGWLHGLIRQVVSQEFKILRLRMRIRHEDPLFMDFMLKLEDDSCAWIKIKYERVFRLYFSCGRIDHNSFTCIWASEQILTALQRQMRRVRSICLVVTGGFFEASLCQWYLSIYESS